MYQVILVLSISFATPSVNVDTGVVVMTEVKYVDQETNNSLSHPLYMDVAFPSESEALLPVIIYIHGGGWASGKREEGLRAIRMFARGNYFAASIDYRLTGEAGFPAAVHDCKAAIKFLKQNAVNLHIDPQNIGIVGYSSGGHLATLVGVTAGDSFLDGRLSGTKTSTEVQCIATISGAVMPHVATGQGENLFSRWALKNPRATLQQALPQQYLNSTDPPIYLLCGSDDIVCPVIYTKQFSEELALKKIEYHLEVLPKRGHLIADPADYLGLLEFIDSKLGGNSRSAMQSFLQTNK